MGQEVGLGGVMGCESYGVVGHPLCVVEGYMVSACGELWGWGALVGLGVTYGMWDCGAPVVCGGGVHCVCVW